MVLASVTMLMVMANIAMAETCTLQATLNGAQSVPSVQTTGNGSVDLTYDKSSRVLSFRGGYRSLTGAITAAHIHRARAGANGPILFFLPSTATISGTIKLSESEERDLLNNRYYINVHTTTVESGEIRGQIILGECEASEASTIDPDAVRQRTQRVIANFISRRNDQITSNEPDMTDRLGGHNNGQGGPVAFTGSSTVKNNRMAFATSLHQIIGAKEATKTKRREDLGQMMALGQQSISGTSRPVTGFDIWVRGTWARVDNDTTRNDIGLLYVGADYRFGPDLVVGLLTQFDWTDEKDAAQNIAADGRGWMAGPYVVTRLNRNLIFDGRVAWGLSDNKVNPLGLYSDSFDGQRWLAKGQFTGDFRYGAVHLAPHVAVIYFEEKQKAQAVWKRRANGSLEHGILLRRDRQILGRYYRWKTYSEPARATCSFESKNHRRLHADARVLIRTHSDSAAFDVEICSRLFRSAHVSTQPGPIATVSALPSPNRRYRSAA